MSSSVSISSSASSISSSALGNTKKVPSVRGSVVAQS
jgi:hypothetical protein